MRRGSRAVWRALRGVHDWAASAPGTYIWLLTVYVTTYVYLHLPSDDQTPFLKRRSTNIHHLNTDPLHVLASSAVWAEGSHLIKFTVMFTVIFAVAERWMGTWRWLGVAALGHVGASYLSQSLVLLGIKTGELPERMRNAVDVGPSYGLMAVAGVLFYKFAGPTRWVYLAALGAYVGFPVYRDRDFTSAGHVTAALIGLACYELVKGRPKWDLRTSRPVTRLAARLRTRGRAESPLLWENSGK
ncbi:rhomboid-like protein [Yinghuangia seranimata]|uniref:rhomboid-like protein n=1 Tax=Yinghuangia seranimata TaxID=408067 RepID=UPI00248BB47D|nr:rhomboid-like protein [Yinghuangia seranimata]MDI2125901.1 hypothetical protein [Yinghuangia seranimata]